MQHNWTAAPLTATRESAQLRCPSTTKNKETFQNDNKIKDDKHKQLLAFENQKILCKNPELAFPWKSWKAQPYMSPASAGPESWSHARMTLSHSRHHSLLSTQLLTWSSRPFSFDPHSKCASRPVLRKPILSNSVFKQLMTSSPC